MRRTTRRRRASPEHKATYTVKLATEPSATVTVTVTGHAGSDLTLDKATLTFTASTWGTAQTVTVTAAEDDDAVDDEVTLAHTASGGDLRVGDGGSAGDGGRRRHGGAGGGPGGGDGR